MDTHDDELAKTLSLPPGEREQQLAAAIHAQVFPGLSHAAPKPQRPVQIHRLGRFTILRELGRGGMGVVYACYDEQLDRKVAVKLLRGRVADEVAHRRLEREAQALARLSHPNVVQIYELGEHYGELFVAMEFIVGQTLKAWLEPKRGEAEANRDWRETARVLRQAGAGLVAAHGAGLVHRDFKPANVLVGDDGRVRVLDFGLVRYAVERELDSTQPDPDAVTLVGDESESDHDGLGLEATFIAKLTRAGTVMGTPAYMAPEQIAAQPCDAASDQFSFCVTAFEALYGHRPFHARTLAALSGRIEAGEVIAPASHNLVPRRLHAAIIRGLSHDPDDRWPDLAALLAEFDAVLGEQTRPWRVAGALGLGLAALVGPLAVDHYAPEPQLCVFEEAALLGTWDDDDRRKLREAHAARGLVAADDSSARIDATLTNWGQRWLDSQRRNCEATRVVGTQSEALLDQRAGCLERQRREVAALADQLTSPAGTGLEHAFELVERLPELAVCDEPRLASLDHPLPTSPETREMILAGFGQISQTRALAIMGQHERADVVVEALEQTVVAANYLPLSLELQLLDAQRPLWRGQLDAAAPRMRALIRAAEVAGLDELSATARVEFANHVVGIWGPLAMQTAILEEAETAVARIGRADDRRHAALASARASWLEDQGDFESALALRSANLERARELDEPAALGRALQALARLYVALARFDEAEQAFFDAQASFTAAHGPSSIDHARVILDRAILELSRERFDDAQALLDTIHEHHGNLLVHGSSIFAMVRLAEAKLSLMRGDFVAAQRGFSEVVEFGTTDVRRAEALEGLGVVAFYRGDMAASLDAYHEARKHYLQVHGPAHADLGILDSNMGESLAASGDHEGALLAYDRALASLGRTLPEDHPNLALPYKARGQSRLTLGEFAAARIDLERALRIHELHPGEPIERSDVEFSLAKVALANDEPERARTLAESARARLVELGHEQLAAPITQWLASL